MNGGKMIELQAVTKIYSMGNIEVPALRGVTLSIQQGEMVAIIGPSGSGKSTLMNIIGCLDVPTSGSYLLDGEDVGHLGDDRLAEIRNRKIGFIFQTYNLLPRLTAQANVELPLLYGNGRDRRRRAKEALERVGLGDRVLHRPPELSGGQQQRVGIARVLAQQPSAILADEPVASLDPVSAREIMSLLREIQASEGLTTLVNLHQVEIAREYADRVIGLNEGRVVYDGAPGALTADVLARIYRRGDEAGADPSAAKLDSPPGGIS